MDFDTLYDHYRQTGNPAPLVAAAPKADNWGQVTMPQGTLPQGWTLMDLLRAAFDSPSTPLHGKLEWADWETMPR